MKSTTYNYIINTIKEGKKIAVQDSDGKWRIFLYIMSLSGSLQGTVCGDSIEECLRGSLDGMEFTKKDLMWQFTDNYIVNDILLNPAPLLPKEGDKVQILENIRELATKEDWHKGYINMIGQKGLTAKKVLDRGCYIFNKDCSDWCSFPSWAVATLPEDYQEEEEVLEITVAQIQEKLGYKIKIVE